MFVFNLPQRVDPMSTSKSPRPGLTDVTPPGPRFNRRPMRNYQAEQIGPTDPNLMGYGPFGTFTSTAMSVESRRRAMAQMRRDTSLINLANNNWNGGRF